MPNEELFLGVLCSLCALHAEQPVRELTTQAVPFTSSVIPLFRHGYLILFPPPEGPTALRWSIMYGFTAYSPEGYFAYQEILEVPGARQPVVRDVDFDAGGNAAVGVSARSGASGMISGICFSIAVDDKPAITIQDVTCLLTSPSRQTAPSGL